MKGVFLALAGCFVLWADAEAQQFGGNGTLTPSTAVSPQGPLPFTPAKILNPLDFGAHCDGSTDDTTALTNWAAAATAGAHLVVPGVCVFRSPIVFPQVNDVALEGSGHPSELLYVGTATTGNIVTIGAPAAPYGCSVAGWSIHGLRLMSNTIMTGGDALRLNDVCQSDIANLDVGGGLGGNQNWFNAVHFNGGNTIHMRGYALSGSGKAEIVNGDASYQFTDLIQIQGELVNSGVGLNVAGRVGGLFVDSTDVLENGTEVLVDQSQVAYPNIQLFFGPGFWSDVTSGGAGIGFNLNDAGGPNSLLFLSGSWIASATNQCFYAQSGVQWTITLSGGTIFNCGSDGFRNDSTTTDVQIAGTRIANNAGYGVNSTVTNANINLQAVKFGSNASGSTNGSVGILTNNSIVDPTTSGAAALTVTAPNNVNGAGIQLTANGATTPSKFLRSYGGWFQILNNAYSASIFTLTDAGLVSLVGPLQSPAVQATGSPPTNSGSCSINKQVGGNTAGSFKFNGACTGGTIILTFATTANGWACSASELTTPADAIKQTSFSPTTATFTATGASGDQATFGCTAF